MSSPIHPFFVRVATVQDAEAACMVVRTSIEESCVADHGGQKERIDAWLNNKTPENFRAWIQSGSLYSVVVEEGDVVVGFGMAADNGELLLCYVLPRVRYRGAGKRLLQAIERWAAVSGICELRLESTHSALSFYRRNGFKVCGPAVLFAEMEGQPMSKQMSSNSLLSRTLDGAV